MFSENVLLTGVCQVNNFFAGSQAKKMQKKVFIFLGKKFPQTVFFRFEFFLEEHSNFHMSIPTTTVCAKTVDHNQRLFQGLLVESFG